jgi:hypothetical protein
MSSTSARSVPPTGTPFPDARTASIWLRTVVGTPIVLAAFGAGGASAVAGWRGGWLLVGVTAACWTVLLSASGFVYLRMQRFLSRAGRRRPPSAPWGRGAILSMQPLPSNVAAALRTAGRPAAPPRPGWFSTWFYAASLLALLAPPLWLTVATG